jgi:tetratricopeptide (TPR) repeat protein
VLLPLLGLLASSAALILAVRRCPRLALAAGWFVLALLPVIQLVPMTTVFADRYLYVALPGALALACDAFGTWLARAHGARRTITLAALAVLLVALAVGTRERSRLWANPEALYAEAVAAYPAGRAGWVGLGAERHRRNDPEGAAAAYLRALALDPNDGHVRHLLGRARLLQERLGEALYDLEEALRLAPRHHDEAWTRATARRLRSQGVQPEEDHE